MDPDGMMNFAVIGAGRVGRVHARNVDAHPRARLRYIVDPLAPALQDLAAQYGARLITDASTALDDPDVQAVVVSAPTPTHVDLLCAAASAGKAVLCEKPMDNDIARLEAGLDHLRQHAVPVLIGFQRRFDPSFRALRDAVRAGELGPIEQVTMVHRDPAPPSLDYVRVSGGIFRDALIHEFDLVRWLLDDDPVALHAVGACLIDPAIGAAGDYDTAMVTLRMPSGALCHIACSRRSAEGTDARIEVFGAKGALRVENAPVNLVDRPHTLPRFVGFPYRFQDAYRAELDHFITAVERGTALETGPEDARRSLIIADAATASACTGNAIELRY